MHRVRRTVVVVAVGCAVPAAAALTVPAYAARGCPDFVAYRSHGSTGPFHYPATHVRRTGDVSCAAVRRMIRSTYGAKGGYHRAYRKDANGNPYGRVTVYWRGGWRCSNGAGGAGCSNVKHRRWSITANVEYAEG